jgi:hypothetical protein
MIKVYDKFDLNNNAALWFCDIIPKLIRLKLII